MNPLFRLTIASVVCPLLALWAQTPAVISASETPQKAFVLGPDDSFTIVALNCEEISKDWRVGSSGDVTFPMIGPVHLAGSTIEKAEADITALLGKYLLNPHVSIFVREMRSRPVTIVGAVAKPGVVQISNWTTLSALLVSAGGPAKNVGTTVTVKRNTQDGVLSGPTVKTDPSGTYSMVELEVRTVLDTPAGPGENADFKVLPNDVVTVAEAIPHFVHILGEVVRPGSAELVTQDSVSLMKMVASAGGFTRLAAQAKVVVMRAVSTDTPADRTVVDMKKIMAGKANDVELRSGDIVLVPSSRTKEILGMIQGSAITSGMNGFMYSTIARF